jgi:nucleoside-diphosphate-sugar epimerase
MSKEPLETQKILLLGASGGCGSWVARLAAERGFRVKAIVRPQTPYDPPAGVKVIRGSVLNHSLFDEHLGDCRYVVSALGIKRKQPLNPWSSLSSPDMFVTKVMKLLMNSPESKSIRKIVAISAAGVGGSIQNVNPLIRWMIRNSNMACSYRDLEAMEEVLEKSGLDWIAVRPVTLRNGPPNYKSGEISNYKLTSSITRGEVARQILDALEEKTNFSSRSPMIGG